MPIYWFIPPLKTLASDSARLGVTTTI